jgi:PAS domain S-box-containing protein
LKKNNGKPIIGSLFAVAVKDEQGKIKYFDGIIEDITNHKRAEKELQVQVKTLRQID